LQGRALAAELLEARADHDRTPHPRVGGVRDGCQHPLCWHGDHGQVHGLLHVLERGEGVDPVDRVGLRMDHAESPREPACTNAVEDGVPDPGAVASYADDGHAARMEKRPK